jgi:hypothetical protein
MRAPILLICCLAACAALVAPSVAAAGVGRRLLQGEAEGQRAALSSNTGVPQGLFWYVPKFTRHIHTSCHHKQAHIHCHAHARQLLHAGPADGQENCSSAAQHTCTLVCALLTMLFALLFSLLCASAATNPPQPSDACTDVPPDNQFTCQQQVGGGGVGCGGSSTSCWPKYGQQLLVQHVGGAYTFQCATGDSAHMQSLRRAPATNTSKFGNALPADIEC